MGFYTQLSIAKKMLEQGNDLSEVKAYLTQNNLDEKQINEILNLLSPQLKNRKLQNGIFLIIAGIIALGFGFISSVMFTDNETLLNISLYGITGIGAILLIIGLSMVF